MRPLLVETVTGASIADLSDLYYLTDGGDLMAEYYKLPWENPERWKTCRRSYASVSHRVNGASLIKRSAKVSFASSSLNRKRCFRKILS